VSGAYVLASDLGSGGCKTVLLDSQGRIVAEARQEYPTHYPYPGWVEQDPEDWYAAFCATTRQVLEASRVAPSAIEAIGIVGVTHNTVLLDEHDRPLRPCILIFDTRSSAQVQTVKRRWGDQVLKRALNDVTTTWSWPQLLWVRETLPDVWQRTRRVLFQKDYVRHRLAPSFVTDTIDAEGSLLFDPLADQWIPEFYNDLGLDPAWLPPIVKPYAKVAVVSPQGAADTGLTEGTPVIAGTTDTVAEVLGAGAVRTGTACVKLASVGRIAVVSDQPVAHPHILNYRHVMDGLWYPGTASKYAASAFRWLREWLWCDDCTTSIYPRMDDAAASVPAGSQGILFHPHLMGQWAPHWDEKLRGNFLGLTVRHGRAHITRAVLEGVAFALRDALTEMESLGLPAHDIRLIGQGANSDLWATIVCNVINRPLMIPQHTDAAFGAALITAMGAGMIAPEPAAVEQAAHVRMRVDPDPELVAVYDTLFDVYREADVALQSISARLYDFERTYSSGRSE
jgi:xylulokinase